MGKGTGLEVARAGANVLACSRQEGEAVEALARELKEIGGVHHVLRADVSVPADIELLVEAARTQFGSVDVLVNNAGVISHIPFEQLPLQEWERVLNTNLTAPFQVIQKVLPLLSAGASIINIGSRAAIVGIPLRSHYTASKAGMIGLTRSLCKEFGRRGIRVNLVAPGVIDTDDGSMSDEEKEMFKKRYENLVSLARFGKPEEVAGAVLFLASDLSTYITGETIHVDGGV